MFTMLEVWYSVCHSLVLMVLMYVSISDTNQKVPILYTWIRAVTKGQGPGIYLAIMSMTPGYFHSKMEPKELPYFGE